MGQSDRTTASYNPLAFLAGGGEMGERIRAFDWSKAPLGPVESWPQSLRSAVSILLPSKAQIILFWGRDLTTLYNDAYRPVFGAKHPRVLGLPGRESWSELWERGGLRGLLEGVLNTGEAFWASDRLFVVERFGYVEETYFDVSYDPVRDETGQVAGVFCIVSETTIRVVSERRLKTLRDLAARTVAEARSVEAACLTAAQFLAENRHDLPFSLLYLLDADAQSARLAGSSGLVAGAPAAPARIKLSEGTGWPLQSVLETHRAQVVTELGERFGFLPADVWPEPTHTAVVLPLTTADQERLAGFLVAGISPRRALDEPYRDFLNLVAGHVAAAVANARAYEEEKKRAEALAELDRAKTAFFSNVSHEFRTPLTLILGPLEEALAEANGHADRGRLLLVQRNALRLQKLVNTLLDFSRIEAGRVQASYEPTDLAALTGELASVFRSAVETAGMRLLVHCPPLSEPVYVDRDMYEKVVLNLLSNAFKFTLAGEIEVRLRETAAAVELSVRDTGTGITAKQLPHIFERFHRVEGTRARTHEGTGIGLALVTELVKLHGGTVSVESVESVEGTGSTFTVAIPKGKAHLPADRIGAAHSLTSTAKAGSLYVEEALRWLPDESLTPGSTDSVPLPTMRRPVSGPRPRIVWADDNADMREYVGRILRPHYGVEAVSDGEAALAAVKREPPDLVLADVMMPRLDGFAFLRALRADERVRTIPVILLSARAGEEARVEGLGAGADDYLVKPFGAAELLARVAAHLQMARLRREADEVLRAREAELREAQRVAHVGSWHWDAATDATTGSDELYRIYGLDPATERFPNFKDQDGLLYLHESWQRINAAVRETLRTGVGYELDVEAFRCGRPIWVTTRSEVVRGTRGEVIGLRGTVQDITERKRAEAVLRESEAVFRTLGEALPDFLWMSDAAGRPIYQNPAWHAYTGLTHEDLARDGWQTMPHPDDLPGLQATWDEAIRGGTPFAVEYRCRRHDGEYRWFLSRTVPVKDDAERVVKWVGTTTDIHDRKQAEEALREADRRKDEFLATLAHELRNPLAPLLSGVQIVRSAGVNGAVERAGAMMERQLAQLVRLVDDLLDVSRITRGKLELRRERVELRAVIDAAVETSRSVVEQAGHELTVTVPPEPVFVDGDPTRLAQIISNLLNNAAKYTHRGGHVRLAAGRDGEAVQVSVADDGIGIPADMLGRVFDLFTQVDRALEKTTGGLGIGLSLVKGLVEMHGGTVEAKSAGEGSEFVVRLPVAVAPVQTPHRERTGEGARAARRRLLVVDDNEDAADSLTQVLEMLGHEVRTTYDGAAGVEAAGAFRPDVVLMDIGMPRLNGYDAARRIRREPWGRDMVLVALTGWGQEDDRQKSADAGFDLHLVKPVETAALTKLLAGLRPVTA